MVGLYLFCLIDAEDHTVNLLSVEFRNGPLTIFPQHLDKTKASGAAGMPGHNNTRGDYRSKWPKDFLETPYPMIGHCCANFLYSINSQWRWNAADIMSTGRD
jgi:hypothetical protein